MASVTGESIAVEGAVQQRRFESILTNQIFIRKEGESLPRAVAIGLIALPLLPLIAVYDLVRYGLFRYGKCDGKSWSLIEKANAKAATLAEKVKSLVQKKELTPQDPNLQSEVKMRSYVKQIIDGFRALNGGFFNSFFDSERAQQGEKQIAQGKDLLAQEIATYVNRNARADNFAACLAGVKDYINAYFIEAGKGDVYVVNKVERKGPQPLLSDWAKEEFSTFLEDHPVIANSFLAHAAKEYKENAAKEGSNLEAARAQLLARLKEGVEQKLISSEQAQKTVEEAAAVVEPQSGAPSDTAEAAAAVQEALDTDADSTLKTPEEEIQADENACPASAEVEKVDAPMPSTVEELVVMAVYKLLQFQAQDPTAKPAVFDQKIVEIAQELKGKSQLAPEDEMEFLNKTRDLLQRVQANLEAIDQIAIQAQKEADEAAAQQAEIERKALVERQILSEALKTLVGDIGNKQQQLLGQYSEYEAQAAEKAQLIAEIRAKFKEKVQVGEKEMTILRAYAYSEKMRAKILAAGGTLEEQNAKLARFDSYFGDHVMALILQVQTLRDKLRELTEAMSETLKPIQLLDLEIAKDIATYKKFAAAEKELLGDELRKEIEALEETIDQTQSEMEAKYRKAHGLSPLAPIPSQDVQPEELDREVFLKAAQVAPSTASWLWNGIKAPFRALGLVQ
jgi:hypothetical protein